MTSTRLLASLFLAVLLGGVIMAAIAMDSLGWLIGGAVGLGIASVALLRASAMPLSVITEAIRKNQEESNRHAEAMADRGYMLMRRGVQYIPLPAPEIETDIPVSTTGETVSTVAPYDKDAYELLVLSKQIMPDKENGVQVAPYHRARKNDYFRDVTIWMGAIKFLLINQIAYEKFSEGKKGRRKDGTFLRSGTIGQALARMTPPPESPIGIE